LKTLEDDLKSSLNRLDVDLNVKVVALDTTTHSRIQTLTDQIIDQRKEDIQTFSDNLHQLQKVKISIELFYEELFIKLFSQFI
jgi:putative N-acetylmannosamine-6-phosphate epimerase